MRFGKPFLNACNHVVQFEKNVRMHIQTGIKLEEAESFMRTFSKSFHIFYYIAHQS